MILFIKKNYKYILFCISLILLNLLFLNNYNFTKIKNDINDFYSIISVIVLIFEIIMCIVLYILKNKNVKIENIYLFLAIPIGLIYMILIPVGLVPDEAAHLGRSYELSLGHFISDTNEKGLGGRLLPEEISNNFKNDDFKNYSEYYKNLNKKNSDNYSFAEFSGASLYSIVCYIPQTIGIFIGRNLNLPILLTAYLGRFMTFLFHILIVYFSIKYIPIFKDIILYITLLPMTMQEAMSLSPDSMTIAISVALLSFVLYHSYGNKNKLTKKDYIIMCILTLMMSLLKIVYIPICLLLYIIPKEKFNSNKDKYIKISLTICFAVIINLLWLSIASNFLSEVRAGVDSSLQLKYILSNPFSYIEVLFNTLQNKGPLYLWSLFGSSLGHLNVKLSQLYIIPAFSILVILILNNINLVKIKQFDKILIILIITLVSGLIFTSLYIQWTPYKNNLIEGVQGRYFLPIVFLIPTLFQKTENKKSTSNNLFLAAFLIFFSAYAFIEIFVKYF